MRSVIRRRALGAQLLVAALSVALGPGGPRLGPQSRPFAEPNARSRASIGEVTGALASGLDPHHPCRRTMPGGWEALHLLEVAITSGNRGPRSDPRFDIEDNKLTVGDQDLIVGTGAIATGEYLRVRRRRRHRDHRRRQPLLRGRCDGGEDDPRGRTVRSSASWTTSATSAEARRPLVAPESGGITWGTVIAADPDRAPGRRRRSGNLFASKRRPPPRLRSTARSSACGPSGQVAPAHDDALAERVCTRPSRRSSRRDPREHDGRGLWIRSRTGSTPRSSARSCADDIEVKEFHLRWGNDYAMIANPRTSFTTSSAPRRSSSSR